MGQRRSKDARKTRNKGDSQTKQPSLTVFNVDGQGKMNNKDSGPQRGSGETNERKQSAAKSVRLRQSVLKGRQTKPKPPVSTYSLSSSSILAELKSESRRRLEPAARSPKAGDASSFKTPITKKVGTKLAQAQ